MVGVVSGAALDYKRLLDGLWDILNCTHEGRKAVLDGLPPAERAVVSQTGGWALELECARRRKTLARALQKSFPVTYFAYVARDGSQGVMRFLESTQARGRAFQPGSCFPPVAPTAVAFAAFLTSIDWASRQLAWVKEACDFEMAYLFGGSRPTARQVGAARVALADGAWVAEASFNVAEMALLLREQGKSDPWEDVLSLLKPRAHPTAIISVPTAKQVRRLQLSGEPLATIRWLWDGSVAVPPDALEEVVLRRMLAAGAVSLERR
jgi:hypothetical protein